MKKLFITFGLSLVAFTKIVSAAPTPAEANPNYQALIAACEEAFRSCVDAGLGGFNCNEAVLAPCLDEAVPYGPKLSKDKKKKKVKKSVSAAQVVQLTD